MKWYAIIWVFVGAAMVAAAIVTFFAQGFGPGTTAVIATLGCVGAPFLAFGVWGLYVELKPYHYEPKGRKQ